jgi:hypothetical protein
MKRKYAQPPLEEALCEFRLAKDVRWDLTVPGLLYEKIKNYFPEKEQRLVQEVKINQEHGKFRQEVQTTEILVFYNQNRNILTQVGPGMVVLNVLKPYPGWEFFKQTILFVWENLLSILPISRLEHASLRYINIINLPSYEEKLEEYLQFYPYLGPELPQEKQLFTIGVEFSYEDDTDHCKLILSTSNKKQEKPTFMLDIEYFTYKLNSLSAESFLSWLEKAHEVIEKIFEGCITDKLRKTFKEEKG